MTVACNTISPVEVSISSEFFTEARVKGLLLPTTIAGHPGVERRQKAALTMPQPNDDPKEIQIKRDHEVEQHCPSERRWAEEQSLNSVCRSLRLCKIRLGSADPALSMQRVDFSL
ncbi:hypothetical protein RRG08_063185 [Elysia crispata]|uniref:Uncharacterized protein n=1 Tax=Elysia crispata TaxID=231223 RepID=A0AAE0YTW1_9GAST|nr:hypothetical protein RRG08_063185 [Elysia crispata]